MLSKKFKRSAAFLFITLVVFLSSCNYQHGLHPVQITGISGTVTFVGNWPENMEWVRILCFQQKPRSENVNDILVALFNAKIGDPVPARVAKYDFTVELEPGVYQWIAVIYNSKTHPLKIIGEYDQPNLVVEKEKIVANINITADFNKLGNLSLSENR